VAAPVVSSISPLLGPPAGGTVVVVTGTGFTGATAVHFGATLATGLAVASDTRIYATSPAGTAGTVDVTVTTGGGTSAAVAADQFSYDTIVTYAPKYTSLVALQAYMRAFVPPGQSELAGDTDALYEAIERAEEAMDCEYASHLEYRTNTLENAEIAFVDANGWLHLQMLHPVLAVSAVQYMDRDAGDVAWTPLVLQNVFPGRSPALYPNDPPTARSYLLEVSSTSPTMSPTPTGGLMVQVTYTSGYQTIPGAVTAVANRYAAWIYQLREMPMGKVADLENHQITVPLDMPRDVKATLRSWRRENF